MLSTTGISSRNKQSDKAANGNFHTLEILSNPRDWENDPDNLSPGLYEWLNASPLSRDDIDDDEGGRSIALT
jgi:hypothetical protein